MTRDVAHLGRKINRLRKKKPVTESCTNVIASLKGDLKEVIKNAKEGI